MLRTPPPPLLVVDAANVVGAVPDGWWRRRAEATGLLRDALEPLAAAGLPAAGLPGPLEVVLVVEGAARGVPGSGSVQVVPARTNGDDAIVALVAARCGERSCTVVTADRALRARVLRHGAAVIGPGALPARAWLA
jgi:hypothetical protein